MTLRQTLKQRLAEDFSASARIYDRYAFLQRRVLGELASAGAWDNLRVLDAGCGTGALARIRPEAEIIGLDIAPGMCREATGNMPAVAADMERLPFATRSMDGVFSSLALQWLARPDRFFAEALRVCRPDGWIRLATLAPGTLQELREAYERIGIAAPVLDFPPPETVSDQLHAAGWKMREMRVKHITTEHASVRDLLYHLKGLGARHKQGRGMRAPGDLRRLEEHYVSAPGRPEGIHAGWQVVMADAVRPR